MRLNSDSHPDAHACRLKISFVTIDAPIICPWDLTRQCSRYITKLSHISLVCRLTLEEELQLLTQCVCDQNDPRFYNEKGQPKYTLYEVTIVKNRKYYLQGLFNQSIQSNVFTVPHQHGTRWPVNRNLSSLMFDSDSFSTLEITYAGPAQLSGHAVLEVIQKFWSQQEDTTGRYGNLGFLFIYELLTKTKTAKFLSRDISDSLAIFLFELLADKNEETLLPSILSLMCRLPYLRDLMPKFKDTRVFKNTTMKAYADDQNPISPLGTLLSEILDILQTQISNIMGSFEQWSDIPPNPLTTCSINLTDLVNWVVPKITDFSSSRRVLSEISVDKCSQFNIEFLLSTKLDDLQNFAGKPLGSIDLHQITRFVTRSDCGLPLLQPEIPFDVSEHPQAKTYVARSMISRLTKDVKEYALSQNSGSIPKCGFLQEVYSYLNEIQQQQQQSLSNFKPSQSRQSLGQLIKDLISLRESDESYVQRALEYLSTSANSVLSSSSSTSSSTSTSSLSFVENDKLLSKPKILYLLDRSCRFEAIIWSEFLFASILSSKQYDDLRRLNPFLSHESIDIISDILISTVLHANRINHINRCLENCRELDSTLLKIEQLTSTPQFKEVVECQAALSLNDDSLSRNLNMERHFIDNNRQNFGGEEKRQRLEMSFDPRFLLFEFTWGILLRKSQVEIVQEYLSNLATGISTVKQMIMGAG